MAQLWFKFWSKEYLADAKIRALTYEQRGMLQTLWSFAWEEGSIPSDMKQVGMMLGVHTNAMRTHSEWISRFFVTDPSDSSKLLSPRLELDRAEADSRGSKARESAMQRWSKSHANALPTQCEGGCESHAGQGQGKLKTTTAPAGRKRRNKDQVLHGFSPDVQRVVRELYPIWPKEGTEGAPTCATSTQDFSQRVSEIIEAGNDPDILIQAAKEYISIPAKKYAAPQFFFGKTGFGGKGEAKWVGFVKFILTRRENANPTA